VGGQKVRQRDFARKLRKELTDAERALWQRLRHCQLGGLKFRRQAPIGNYFADFVCYERKLIVELDGGQHASPEEQERDAERTRWLNSQGFRVVRYWDHDVLRDLEVVLESIWLALQQPPTLPSPTRGGGYVNLRENPALRTGSDSKPPTLPSPTRGRV
jgi:very-short-patch-repair endonuclease